MANTTVLFLGDIHFFIDIFYFLLVIFVSLVEPIFQRVNNVFALWG